MHKFIFVICLIGAASAASAQSLPAYSPSLAQAKCEDDWTKRGVLDQRMFEYCLSREEDGYAQAQSNVLKYKDVVMIDGIVAQAIDQWLNPHDYQYAMVAYEIEREGEAFLDLSYDIQQQKYSVAEVQRCKDEWLKPHEPQWTMVLYCLEN